MSGVRRPRQGEPDEVNRRQHRAVGVTARALDEYACRVCAGARAAAAVEGRR